MIRRLQLLESEPRVSAWGMAGLGDRIRDGLLRDNKVIPPVLAVLSLLVFAWLIGGVFMGDPGEEEEQRASNQASLGQGSREEDLERRSPETPAPEAENRDADSYAAFEPKDPFRDLIPKAGEGDKGGSGKAGKSKAGEGDNSKGKNKAGEGKAKSRAGEGKDFIDQSFPEGAGSGNRRGAAAGGGSNQDAGADRGGNLFDSGGDLAP